MGWIFNEIFFVHLKTPRFGSWEFFEFSQGTWWILILCWAAPVKFENVFLPLPLRKILTTIYNWDVYSFLHSEAIHSILDPNSNFATKIIIILIGGKKKRNYNSIRRSFSTLLPSSFSKGVPRMVGGQKINSLERRKGKILLFRL